jgi:mRNA interferase MazF
MTAEAKISPKRGEIWLVDLEPTRGSEMQKMRPAVVLSSNAIRSLPVRVVVPLTGWQEQFQSSPWKIKLKPESRSTLTKISAVDCLQIRCLSLERFVERRGAVSKEIIEEILDGVHYCLEE